MSGMDTRTTGELIISGGSHEGEYRTARLLYNGDTVQVLVRDEANANARCASCKPAKRDRWMTIDTVHEATVTDRADGSYDIHGISQHLRDEVRVPKADQKISMAMIPRGCQSCS